MTEPTPALFAGVKVGHRLNDVGIFAGTTSLQVLLVILIPGSSIPKRVTKPALDLGVVLEY